MRTRGRSSSTWRHRFELKLTRVSRGIFAALSCVRRHAQQRTQAQLQATLSYELDFWGRNRAAYESALGQAKAAEVDAFAARLALSASIAQAYVQLQHAYLQLGGGA